MSNGPELTLINWVLSVVPIAALIITILWRRWSAARAGALSWILALAISLLAFGGDPVTMAIASSKGLVLSFFVLSIVWTSVLLFVVAERSGGIAAIGHTISRWAKDPLTQALLIGWAFSGFIQGITGFGVPVAVATPLLMMMGFPLARAAAIVLIGHGWAVTFGSLGSSYYTIQLVTGIEPDLIASHMAMLFAVPIIATGFVVAHLQGGMNAVRRSIPLVIVVGTAMATTMWVLASIGAPQIASTLSGIVGTIGIALASKVLMKSRIDPLDSSSEGPRRNDNCQMNFHLGFFPYYCLIFLSVAAQFTPVQQITQNLAWGFDFPGFTTDKGFSVPPAEDYAEIRLLNHPAPLLLISLLLTSIVYWRSKRWIQGTASVALKQTYSQSLGTTVGVGTMVMMALLMADTGASTLLAEGIARISGPMFPLASPFIGVIGSFMTGSNTNSNVMFGLLQLETARALGIGTVTIASIQSIGASLGSTLAPAKVLVATTLTGLTGREGEILRLVIPYVLGLVFLVGLQALLINLAIPSLAK